MDRSKKSSQRRRANVNIHDVARRARVSIATVSRVVNRIPTVDPELAKRVWKAVDDVGYVPNTQARALVSGRSRILGLIVSEITNPFFPELVQEFENLAVAQGYEVMIGSTNYNTERTESLIRRMLQRSVDGVAVMTFGIEEELVHTLVDHGFPLVFVDAGPELPNVRVLKVNYGDGIREAVQHLAALGHRQIAFISGPLQMRTAAIRLPQCDGRTGTDRSSRVDSRRQAHHGERQGGDGAINENAGAAHGGRLLKRHDGHRRASCARRNYPQGSQGYFCGGIRRHSPGAVHAAAADHGANVVQRFSDCGRRGVARRHRIGSSQVRAAGVADPDSFGSAAVDGLSARLAASAKQSCG
jgi:DNA-binding LacI/PurR family transcriptional regulator